MRLGDADLMAVPFDRSVHATMSYSPVPRLVAPLVLGSALGWGCSGSAASTPGASPASVTVGAHEQEAAPTERHGAPPYDERTLGRWRWTDGMLAFSAGRHAGVFDPNHAKPGLSVLASDAQQFACVLAGRTGQALVTLDTQGVVSLWRGNGRPVFTTSSPYLKRPYGGACSAVGSLESRVVVRFAADDKRLILEFRDHGVRELRLWDEDQGMQDVPVPEDCEARLAGFAPGDRFIEIGCQRYLPVYDPVRESIVFEADERVIWQHDGALLAAIRREDRDVSVVFDPNDERVVATCKSFAPASLSPSGRFLFGWAPIRAKAELVDLKTLAKPLKLRLTVSSSYQTLWTPEGTFAFASNAAVGFWSTRAPQVQTVPVMTEATTLVQSHDGMRFVSHGKLWDARRKKPLFDLEAPRNGVLPVSFSHDDSLILGQTGDDWLVWNTSDGRIVSRVTQAGVGAFDTPDWASERAVLVGIDDDDDRWITLFDPLQNVGLRLRPVADAHGAGFVAVDQRCWDGPEWAPLELSEDLAARHHCPGLLAKFAASLAR